MTIEAEISARFQSLAEKLARAGVVFDGLQFATVAVGMLSDHDFAIKKTEPKSEEQIAEATERRKTMLHWLLTHPAPDYNGARETCLSLGEILDRMGKPQNAQNNGTLRAILSNRFLCDWGMVTEIAGQRLYARVPRLLAFAPRVGAAPSAAVA